MYVIDKDNGAMLKDLLDREADPNSKTTASIVDRLYKSRKDLLGRIDRGYKSRRDLLGRGADPNSNTTASSRIERVYKSAKGGVGACFNLLHG